MAQATERAALVGVVTSASRSDADNSLDELAGLADAAGARVVLRMQQERSKPDPATFIGAGKVASLAAACDEADVGVVIFDNELSPAQLRQLEERLERKVIDRTQLILDIFARRARTREGKWQVELAQLKYLLPRLLGRGRALWRLGGGVGSRGAPHRPGRTGQTEVGNRSPADPRAHSIDSEGDRSRPPAPVAATRAAAQAVGADRRPRWLHQRRQDDVVQPVDGRNGGRFGRAVRHAGSSRPPRASP